jgi:hypothetical protein
MLKCFNNMQAVSKTSDYVNKVYTVNKVYIWVNRLFL